MIYTELTKRAIHIAFKAHDGLFDKAGMPYIVHPLLLADKMETESATAVALLHDVLEDSDETTFSLARQGIPVSVIQSLLLLTHKRGVPYLDYVQSIADSGDQDAIQVKRADLEHNMDLTRLDKVTQKDEQRVEKYKKAMKLLRGYHE